MAIDARHIANTLIRFKRISHTLYNAYGMLVGTRTVPASWQGARALAEQTIQLMTELIEDINNDFPKAPPAAPVPSK